MVLFGMKAGHANVSTAFTPSWVEEARTEHLSPPPSAPTQGSPLFAGLNSQLLLGLGSSSLSSPAFKRQALEWENQIRAEWQENLGRIAGAALPGLVIELGNRQSTFLEAVRFDLTLEDAYGVDTEEADVVTSDKLFPPLIEKQNPFDPRGLGLLPPNFSNITPALSQYPLKWMNAGANLHITIELDQLRPGAPWVSDGDDFLSSPGITSPRCRALGEPPSAGTMKPLKVRSLCLWVRNRIFRRSTGSWADKVRTCLAYCRRLPCNSTSSDVSSGRGRADSRRSAFPVQPQVKQIPS